MTRDELLREAYETLRSKEESTRYTDDALDEQQALEYFQSLSKEEQIEHLKMMDDMDTYEEFSPIYRFRLINDHQICFLKSNTKFTIIFAGNQSGKSAVLIFKMILMAKGMLKEFPHKPKPGRPLMFLFGCTTNEIFRHSLLPEILKWTRPGEVEVHKGSSGTIDSIEIKNSDGSKTIIVVKSYEAGARRFVSYKFHAIFCDEPFEEAILNEILPRTIAYNAPINLAMTKTPDHTGPKYKWLKQIYKGADKYKKYHDEKKVTIIMASSYDNKVLEKEAIDDALGHHAIGSTDHNMRVMGIPDDPEGPVYGSFSPYINDPETNARIPWHVGTLKDLMIDIPDLTRIQDYNVAIGLDYGQSAPFAAVLFFESLRTGTVWGVDEVYQAGLDPYQQMRKVKAMCMKWGVRPYVCVCDDQIENPSADWSKDIKIEYEDALERIKKEDKDDWDLFLYTSRSYKKDKTSGIGILNRGFNTINTNTNFPIVRYLDFCMHTINEIESLVWANKQTHTGRELTSGADHGESASRYYMCSVYGPDLLSKYVEN